MSNIHLFLSLAGFTTALFAWFRFDINKRFDDMKASTNQRFNDVNNRFNDITTLINQRFDDMNNRFNDMNRRIDDVNTSMHKRIDDQNATLARAVAEEPGPYDNP